MKWLQILKISIRIVNFDIIFGFGKVYFFMPSGKSFNEELEEQKFELLMLNSTLLVGK